MTRLTTISLLCAFLAVSALGATDFGPPVGKPFRVSDLALGPKGAAILFHGSKAQLAELDRHREAFQKLGVQVAAMSGARTGWIVLDARSIVVAKYFEDDPNQCLTSAAVLVHRFGWTPPGPANQVQGKQLTATTVASNSTVAPGQRVALSVDVELYPNMHVYAPGVEGYIPIDWKMQDSSTALVHAPVFPKSEKLYLKAIDETVPAFRNHFRLLRDITIPSESTLKPAIDSSGHITVDASLRYQACDDRVCYIPQELRLRWTFEYHPPDQQRPPEALHQR
jgi:Thiol:disulfide interchange protein DsbD, N-terminal